MDERVYYKRINRAAKVTLVLCNNNYNKFKWPLGVCFFIELSNNDCLSWLVNKAIYIWYGCEVKQYHIPMFIYLGKTVILFLDIELSLYR